ncbi:MAG TPA: cation transporter, partial [Syntrophobacteraceae bacterium]|nr:cation transporter [Syntrophobacteraceae bacterium]
MAKFESVPLSPPEAAPSGKTTIRLGGMSCAACVRRVERALEAVQGVREASVNLALSRATVVHDPRTGIPAALKKAVEDAGFEYLGVFEEALDDPMEAAAEREIRDLRNRVLVGAVLSLLIMLGSMKDGLPLLRDVPLQPTRYLLFLLTTPVIFWVGNRFLAGALKAARQKTADMNTLVAMGSLAGYLYSTIATVWPDFFAVPGSEVH